MDDQYVARRVEQALKKANGDMAVAQRLIERLCAFDAELMQRLVSPYLPGIIARTVSPDAAPKRAPAKPSAPKAARVMPKMENAGGPAGAPDLPTEALDAVIGRMAEHIGETKSPKGMTALVQPAVKTTCSPRHLEAVQTLVSAYSGR